MNLSTLISKISKYNTTKENTLKYREAWHGGLKDSVTKTLQEIIDSTELNAKVEYKEEVENLEAIIFNLGRRKSGIKEKLSDGDSRSLVRNDGMLVYQQLYNGKIMVLIMFPYIESYGEPQQPKTLEIVRPDELTDGFIIRHIEELLKELTAWEDYDDEKPASPPIGFSNNYQLTTNEDPA